MAAAKVCRRGAWRRYVRVRFSPPGLMSVLPEDSETVVSLHVILSITEGTHGSTQFQGLGVRPTANEGYPDAGNAERRLIMMKTK